VETQLDEEAGRVRAMTCGSSICAAWTNRTAIIRRPTPLPWTSGTTTIERISAMSAHKTTSDPQPTIWPSSLATTHSRTV
jgi:hypothetical protein